MKILNRITLNNLKRNRTRTTVTIVGIILSTALITAVATFLSSVRHFMIESYKEIKGDWHISCEDARGADVQALASDGRLEDFSVGRTVGYAFVNSINPYKPYLYVMAGNDVFFGKMPVHVTQGRLPQNEREILLPDHLHTNGGVNYSLGDVLSLDLGKRMYEGEELGRQTELQTKPSQKEGDFDDISLETLRITGSASYEVVGFYERPDFELYSAPGYTALTLLADNARAIAQDGENRYFAWFKCKEVDEVFKIKEELMNAGSAGSKWGSNNVLLRAYGKSAYGSFERTLKSVAAILIVIIMCGSILLIYNAFAISVSERTWQFGLLSSIGATRRQIRHSVLFEALLVSLVGIPGGIALGIGGIGITLLAINPIMRSLLPVRTSFLLSVSLTAVLTAAGVAAVTVLLSVWIPAARAMRVTAIEAIRRNKEYKISARDVRTLGLTGKIFGFEGALAEKYFKRNRKKYRITIISLFISIVMFIPVSSMCAYLVDSVNGTFESADYDISINVDEKDLSWNELKNKITAVDEVDSAVIHTSASGFLYYEQNEDYLSKKYKNDVILANSPNSGIEGAMTDTMLNDVIFVIVDNETFEAYCRKNKLDAASFTNRGNPLFICRNQYRTFDANEQRMKNMEILDPKAAKLVFVPAGEKEAKEISQGQTPSGRELNIGYFANELVPGCGQYANHVTLLIPESMVDFLGLDKGRTLDCFIQAERHEAAAKNIEEMLNGTGIGSYGLFDRRAVEEANDNLLFVVQVFVYGFIIMISLIAVTNVFNTISTNVMLRRKEFAMLKAVGITRRGLNRMMNFECLLYGLRALMYGLPVSVLITWLIYKYVIQIYEFRFYIPTYSVVLVVCSVFAMVFVTMLYAMHKVKKENVIDILKRDNF